MKFHHHRINWIDTEFMPDGSRIHRCEMKGCFKAVILPRLLFTDGGERVRERRQPPIVLTEVLKNYGGN